MNKDFDPANRRFGAHRDRHRGRGAAWARLNDLYTVDGRHDVERANQQIDFLLTLIRSGADTVVDRHSELAHAIAELAVANHERKHHGRKDFH